MAKTKVSKGGLKVKVYQVMHRAIEEGVSLGLHRAVKHRDDVIPDSLAEAIRVQVEGAVMEAILDVFTFGDSDD